MPHLRAVLILVALATTTAAADDGPATTTTDAAVAATQALAQDQRRLDQLDRLLRLLPWHDGDYVPIALLLPGQLRFASANVADKVAQALKAGDAAIAPGGGYQRKHDGGRSILPPSRALPVIRGPAGYVLVDGHHDVLSSLALGAVTVPITVVGADLSRLSPPEFWRQAEADGFVYPHQVGGAWQVPPRRFAELVDDPVRYFAAISARKCAAVDQDPAASTGAEFPLWIKIGKDLPFIEFRIADALVAADPGFAAAAGDGASLEPALVEHARALLTAHPVAGLRLVPARRAVPELGALCGDDQRQSP